MFLTHKTNSTSSQSKLQEEFTAPQPMPFRRQSFSGPLPTAPLPASTQDIEALPEKLEDLVKRATEVANTSKRLHNDRRRSLDLSNAATRSMQDFIPPSRGSRLSTHSGENSQERNIATMKRTPNRMLKTGKGHMVLKVDKKQLENSILQIHGAGVLDVPPLTPEALQMRQQSSREEFHNNTEQVDQKSTFKNPKSNPRSSKNGASKSMDSKNGAPKSMEDRTGPNTHDTMARLLIQSPHPAPSWLQSESNQSSSMLPRANQKEKLAQQHLDDSDSDDEPFDISLMSAPALRLHVRGLRSKFNALKQKHRSALQRTITPSNNTESLTGPAKRVIYRLNDKIYQQSIVIQNLTTELKQRSSTMNNETLNEYNESKEQHELKSDTGNLEKNETGIIDSKQTVLVDDSTSTCSSCGILKSTLSKEIDSEETAQNEHITEYCEKLEKDCADLCHKLAEKVNECVAHENNIEQQLARIASLEAKVKHQEETTNDAAKVLESYEEMKLEVSHSKSMLKRKSRDAENRKGSLNKLRNKFQHAEERRIEADRKVAEITIKLDQLNAQIIRDKNDKEDEKRVHERTLERIKVTESEVVELRAQLESSASLHSIRERLLTEVTEKCAQLETKEMKLEAELSNERQQNSILEDKVKELNLKLNRSLKELNQYETCTKEFASLVRSSVPLALQHGSDIPQRGIELTRWAETLAIQQLKHLNSEVETFEAKLGNMEASTVSRIKQVEEAALKSLVRLCVAAPTVNVHVGVERDRILCKPRPNDDAVRKVIEDEILPKYTSFYVQHANGAELNDKQMEQWLKTLVTELQQSIQKHLAGLMKQEKRH